MSALRRLASAQSVPVFPAIGRDARAAVEDLALDPAVSLKPSPRHAGLLLVAGEIRAEDCAALRRLHDQLPHPRATLWWGGEPAVDFAHGVVLAAGDDPGQALTATWRRLVAGDMPSEPDLLPDEPPAPWRGKGDHGQGGEGMMGGTPYGRPMPMTDDDLRDGLALDPYTADFGPFLPMFPPGLLLELSLQGDVVQCASVRRAPSTQAGEPARAAALRSIARLLRLLGLSALADRYVGAARTLAEGGEPDLRVLDRLLRWSGAVQAIPPGLGAVHGGDVRDRLRRWCTAATHGGDEADAGGTAAAGDRLADLLPGLEWCEACLVVNSFDHAALRRLSAPDRPGRDGAAA